MNPWLALYPNAWRTRYGDEIAALLAERPPLGIAGELAVAAGSAQDLVRCGSSCRTTPAGWSSV